MLLASEFNLKGGRNSFKSTTTSRGSLSGAPSCISSRRMSADAILPLEARNEKRTTLLIIAVTVPGADVGTRRFVVGRPVNAHNTRLLSMLLDS